MAAPPRGPAPPPGVERGHRAFGPNAAAMPAERSIDFRASVARLLRMMRPERHLLLAVLLLGVAGISMTVTGPRLLGEATDRVFASVVGRELPAGFDREKAIADLRADGRDDLANLVQTVV